MTNFLRVFLVLVVALTGAQIRAQKPQRKSNPKPPASSSPTPKPSQKPQSDSAKDGQKSGRGPSLLDILSDKSMDPVMAPRPQPRRPALDLDVQDRAACIAALASLASLPYRLDSKPHRGAVGLDPDTEKWVLLDESARFFALQSAADPEIRELAKQVQEIWIENWRMHAANELFGGSRDWAARSLWQRATAASAYVIGKDVATMTRDKEQIVCTGPDGKPMTMEVLSNEPSTLEYVIDSAFAKAQRSNRGEYESRRAVSLDLDVVRGLAHERLLGLWADRLGSLVRSVSGPATATPPIKVMSALDVENTRAEGWGASALVVTTAGKEAVTDLSLEVNLKSGRGELMRWFGHLARLDPGQQWLIYPAGLWWGALMTAGQVGGSVSVWSRQGCCLWIPFAAGEGNGNRYVHEQRLRDIREHLAAAPRTSAALSRLGDRPRDPVLARRKLLEALGKRGTFQGYAEQRDGDMILTANSPCRLTFEEWDADTDLVTVSLTMWALGDNPVQVRGRIEDEVARGCVLALDFSRILNERYLAERRDRVKGKHHEDFDARAQKERQQWALSEAVWLRREAWLVTDIFEIASLSAARENPSAGALYYLASGGTSRDMRRVEELQRSHSAHFVLFVESDGTLCAQILSGNVSLLAGMPGTISTVRLKMVDPTEGSSK